MASSSTKKTTQLIPMSNIRLLSRLAEPTRVPNVAPFNEADILNLENCGQENGRLSSDQIRVIKDMLDNLRPVRNHYQDDCQCEEEDMHLRCPWQFQYFTFPTGGGKTYPACAVALLWAQRGHKVIITCPEHASYDNIREHLDPDDYDDDRVTAFCRVLQCNKDDYVAFLQSKICVLDVKKHTPRTLLNKRIILVLPSQFYFLSFKNNSVKAKQLAQALLENVSYVFTEEASRFAKVKASDCFRPTLNKIQLAAQLGVFGSTASIIRDLGDPWFIGQGIPTLPAVLHVMDKIELSVLLDKTTRKMEIGMFDMFLMFFMLLIPILFSESIQTKNQVKEIAGVFPHGLGSSIFQYASQILDLMQKSQCFVIKGLIYISCDQDWFTSHLNLLFENFNIRHPTLNRPLRAVVYDRDTIHIDRGNPANNTAFDFLVADQK